MNDIFSLPRWAILPEFDKLPPDWELAPLTKIAKLIAGQSPPSESYNEKGEGLPFLQGNADFADRFPVPRIWCSMPKKICNAGATLISVRAPVGELNRADRSYALGRGLAALEAVKIDPEYLYYGMTHWRKCLQRVGQGTTFDAVTARHFARMMVLVPPPEEQQEIARILDAVDAALERTRSAIDQAHRLKRGLMQRVFSEGVGHHAFKKTELGRIPYSWEVIKGKDAFRTLGGYAPSAIRFAKAWQDPDCWFMKVDDFNSSENLRRITKTKLAFRTVDNPKVATLPLGTVVIAKRGAAILKNRVRTTAVPVSLDPNLMGLHLADDLDPEFFRLQLEWRQLSRYIESSGVPQLNNKDLYPGSF